MIMILRMFERRLVSISLSLSQIHIYIKAIVNSYNSNRFDPIKK